MDARDPEQELDSALAALAAGDDGIVVTDAQGRVTYANAAFRRLCGYGDDRLLGHDPGHLLQGPGTDPLAVARIRAALAARRPVTEELLNYAADGRPYWVSMRITPVLDGDGAVRRFVAVEREVTTAKALELALRESQERFRAMIEHAADAITIVDADGTIRYASPSYERMFGLPADARLGASVWERIHPDDLDELMAAFAALLAVPGRTAEAQFRARHGDGTWRHIAVVAHNLLENAAVRGVVINSRDVTERLTAEQALRESEARFRHQALHDPLTGLANRTLLLDRIAHALARAARDGAMPALLFLDLDEFKQVNDSAGHAAGDRLLVVAAERLCAAVRFGDTVARLGGDEFAILLEGTHAEREADEVADRILAALRVPIPVDGRAHRIGASIGIALSSRWGSADELLHRADSAMYAAKARGGNQYAVRGPLIGGLGSVFDGSVGVRPEPGP